MYEKYSVVWRGEGGGYRAYCRIYNAHNLILYLRLGRFAFLRVFLHVRNFEDWVIVLGKVLYEQQRTGVGVFICERHRKRDERNTFVKRETERKCETTITTTISTESSWKITTTDQAYSRWITTTTR